MSSAEDKKRNLARRKKRIRKKVLGTAERPRLSVYRSLNHIYAQIIDDTQARTIIGVSTLSKELKGKLKNSDTTEAAKQVGALVAQKAQEMNIHQVIFDRNGCLYHGRIKALAETAREKGLKF